MREYSIEIPEERKSIYPAKTKLGGTNPNGDQISFTNYYMLVNNQPFFGICGEFHYSRYQFEKWEDEIIKMKMGGINMVATYIFWNHHEEEQGVFDWAGNKDLRTFVELCGKHGLYVILRIGPFAHGEARNGGLPDWLFGRPFDLRSNDEEYLTIVKRLYKEIGSQVQGFMFKDGGPVIGTQLENEYEHAGAPWEITSGTGNEWLPAGKDGDQHILTLKELAMEAGIVTPIYTCTGWGGAAAPPEEVLPLWGGYAFWPWIFYGDAKEHPATPEFIFRDYHNDETKIKGYEPNYHPETLPFACCEMGGGMTNFYKYRFKLPYESVDALAEVKVAGGCNFVGYYVFHGGSNPKGKKTPFLNENATPKISYDYQAPIGEFGQVRDSYKRLKRQHYFYKTVESSFLKTQTVLPYDTSEMDPLDTETLRYAVRGDGNSGFVFINNYQDHAETKDQINFAIQIRQETDSLRIPKENGLSLAKDACCILPYYFEMEDALLKYATTQLITKLEVKGEAYYFFFVPKGMSGEYCFGRAEVEIIEADAAEIISNEQDVIIRVSDQEMSVCTVTLPSMSKFHIVTLTDEQSLNLWKVLIKGTERIFITNSTVLAADDSIRLETYHEDRLELKVFPSLGGLKAAGKEIAAKKSAGIFEEYYMAANRKTLPIDVRNVSSSKAVINFSPEVFENSKELLLNIDYAGDIGYAFIDGELIHDNFCNSDTWQIGLKQYQKELLEKGMYIYVSPLKENSRVKSDSPMAARAEIINKQMVEIKSIFATAVQEIEIEVLS
ncbi:beta-galactosidase [Bacillus sp. MRMR6]|uniref:beta-galactosidase n=1 Tax=Bacillus sp. MRMR6 TaxID=1928617 RepID=UPI00095111DD|nr:beta-galactosidase [Bacillus sp. MRMR6]OLS42191.1 glycosyl hydrolase family 35 [Bacillus sp. MRMR6]